MRCCVRQQLAHSRHLLDVELRPSAKGYSSCSPIDHLVGIAERGEAEHLPAFVSLERLIDGG
jgi:hypothetical protein